MDQEYTISLSSTANSIKLFSSKLEKGILRGADARGSADRPDWEVLTEDQTET